MSRSEDYLDQLLKGVSPEDKEEDIFGDILDEFAEENVESPELDDDFLKEFELEMAKLENEPEDTSKDTSEEDVLSLFDDLDSILNGAKEQMEATVEESEVEPEAESVVEETPVVSEENNAALEAFLGTSESTTSEEPTSIGGFSLENLFADDATDNATEEAPQEDADVLKILQGLEGIDLELDEEDNTGAAPANDSSEDSNIDVESFAFEENTEKPAKKKKEKKAGEKTGFMNKLGLILFGEDDDEEEENEKKKNTVAPGPAEQGEIQIGEASAADLSLFEEYSGSSTSSGGEEAPAKKDKKEKKKKEKKERVKKEKKPRPKKEKKPKKPKEPDNTPPLPKKPVFLIFLMVGSLLALILMGADMLGYANQMTSAKNLYAKKNYSEAFAEISGIEVKKEDQVLYNKYHVMAMVSVELEAYESLVEQGFYDMALDSLVRTVGRAEKYREDAENYGCIQELNELELKAEEILSETFGVSKDEALEFYTYRSKKEYSVALQNVIRDLGLEKVTE